MATIDRILVDILDVVDRQLRPRQDQIPAPSTTPVDTSTPTDPINMPSQSSSSMTGSQPSGGPTSSPLLFFVALGFGVVFTNLWIIVGVKYCFRYNARNRAMRGGNDVDPINLDNMHARPHRRRREKRLMTMDEVNERFPLTKYKTWAASRAREGLPVNGGISRNSSFAHSLRNQIHPVPTTEIIDNHVKSTAADCEARITNELPPKPIPEQADQEKIQISEKHAISTKKEDPKNLLETQSAQNIVLPVDNKTILTSEGEEDDEDDQINMAVSPEMIASPGDSCAICIDTLEEEDEIRGLSCGHAFHAGCLDPWLTSRRACCPLCKADYYTPKIRADAENIDAERLSQRRNERPAMSQLSQSVWNTILASSRLTRLRNISDSQNTAQNNINSHPAPASTINQPIRSTAVEAVQTRRFGISTLTNIRNFNLPGMRVNARSNQVVDETTNNPSISPSQLEAGIRR
ncbi:putative ring-8 protein [Golovinomyces cichoracearum]|uniref:Putative ring-8 protein n=1 Tax=Golovinomyces cichoracearum TaxID=62708 RepID=A0A420IZM9_9PEZI|nr:putative ring-8 protein [Golovinomyces cichoracearum]